MIAVALPAIADTFQASPGDLTLWLVTSYLLVNIVLQSPAGKLGDIVGRRKAFGIGTGLFVVGAVIATFASSVALLAVSRILMAAGGAMLMPNASALLRTVIPRDKRSRVFGYYGALLSASAAVGPLIGGWLTQFFGWKAIFLANIPVLLLCWYLVQSDHGLKSTRPADASFKGFDFTGMLLLAIALVVLVTGLKADGFWPLAAVLFGGIGFFGFARWEARVSDPLIDLNLFRRVPFVVGGTVTGLHNLGMYALLFQLPFLLQAWYGLSAAGIGPVMLTMMIFMVFLAPIGGRLSERVGTRAIILTGLATALGGMTLLFITIGEASLIWMYLSLSGVGAGLGIVSGPIQSTALSAVPAEQSGVASGILSTMRYLGGVAGISIISVILVGTDPTVLLAQNRLCVGIYVGVYLLALVLVIMFPDQPRKNRGIETA